ncbi:MAG: homogentisate 1,2-dioxygenase [Alphaproteobacteria bacterium]|nr:homogentisate 1,2-dioxygenase [Alphaproteobacteria bacterium]
MARKWISLPRSEGQASRQAHVDLPPGTFEREMGREGFFGPATQFYHRHPPTDWIDWEGPLRPRCFETAKLEATADSPWAANRLLSNAHVQYRFWRLDRLMPRLARNGDGDELLFVHAGEGELYCDFGHLRYAEGDYIVLPRGTMWRLEPRVASALLLIEATNDAFRLPEKGLLGEHAIFDPAVLATPRLNEAFRAQQNERSWQVEIKRRDKVSRVTYPFNPLDAVGWKGDLAPVKLNWRDIRPVTSARYHVPPSAHTTFLTNRFVVCSFVPRPFESEPGALKVPYFHSNDDYDEVIFFHAGKFFSRDNSPPGMISFHPSGFPHGPHPKAQASMFKAPATMTQEVAVMLDARDALEVAPEAAAIEWTGYVDSWGAGERRKAAE